MDAELVMHLANKLQLKKYALICIEAAKAGGGKQHEVFLRYLIHPTSNVKIEDVTNALEQLEMNEAKEIWQAISLGKSRISEIELWDVQRMEAYLVSDLTNLTKSWIDLADQLDMDMNIVESFKQVQQMSGKYSVVDELFKQLKMADKNVRQLVEALIEIDDDQYMPSCMNVLNKVANDVKKKLGSSQESQGHRNVGVKKRDVKSLIGSDVLQSTGVEDLSVTTSIQSQKDRGNRDVMTKGTHSQMEGASASPVAVQPKRESIYSKVLNIYFSLHVVRKFYLLGIFPINEYRLTDKDSKLNSPIHKSIIKAIRKVFEEQVEQHFPEMRDDLELRVHQSVLVEQSNYLSFSISIEPTAGNTIPRKYQNYDTDESLELWQQIEDVVKRAATFEYFETTVDLEEWLFSSIIMVVNVTKNVNCLWKAEEVESFLKRATYGMEQLQLDPPLHFDSITLDNFMKFQIDFTSSYEHAIDAVESIWPACERKLVHRALNGDPNFKPIPVATEKSVIDTAINSLSLEETEVNVLPTNGKDTPHVCVDDFAELMVLVHDEHNARDMLFKDQVCYEKIKIELQLGGGSFITSYQQWVNHCMNIYGRKDQDANILEGSFVLLKKPGGWKERLANLLRAMLDDAIFMTDNFEIQDHFLFLGIDPFEISSEYYKSYSSVFKHFEHVLVFVPSKKVMLMMLVIETSEKKNLYLQLNQGLYSLPCAAKRYIELNHEYLREGEITLVTSIITPTISSAKLMSLNLREKGQEERKNSTLCRKCRDKLVLCKDQLEDDDKFRNWFKELIDKREESKSSNVTLQNAHERMLVQLRGFMDTRCLRTTDKVGHSRSILLSKLQRDVLADEALKVIVEGAYGSGKSIVLKLKMMQLVKQLTNDETIFYVTYNKTSLLSEEMRNFSESLKLIQGKDITIKVMDFSELPEYFDTREQKEIKRSTPPQISLATFFEKISKIRNCHAIIDEFNPAETTDSDITEINKILISPSLLNSYIWIAVVPLSRSRKLGEEPISLGKDTKIFSNMKVLSLDKTFRCSKDIHRLVEIAVEVIEDHPTKFPYQKSKKARKARKKQERDWKSRIFKIFQKSKKETGNQEYSKSTREDEIPELTNRSGENRQALNKQPLQAITQDNQAPLTTNHISHSGDLMDEFMKQAGGMKTGENVLSLETDFRFLKSRTCDVSFEKAVLITPFPNNECTEMSEFEKVLRIYLSLEMIKIKQGKTAIICTNVKEYTTFHHALVMMKELDPNLYQYRVISYLPTLLKEKDEKSEAKSVFKAISELENYILLTDVNGTTGLEFLKVIVPLTPSEEFQSYTLIRSMTRCQSELTLIQCPWEKSTGNPITAAVIGAWREKEVVNQKFIEIKEKCSCSKDSKELPYEVEKNRTTWHVCPHEKIKYCFEKVVSTSDGNSLHSSSDALKRNAAETVMNIIEELRKGQAAAVSLDAEETIEEKARREVMEMPLKNISTRKFEQELNLDHGEALFFVARSLNFTREELQTVRNCQSGGGQPNAQFVHYLCSTDVTTEEVLRGLNNIENTEGAHILQDIVNEKGYKYLYKLEPKETLKLFDPLAIDPTIPGAEMKGWKGLAEELDMNEEMYALAETGKNLGIYSGGEDFMRIMRAKNGTVGDLLDDLHKLNEDEQQLNLTSVINSFEECISAKIAKIETLGGNVNR